MIAFLVAFFIIVAPFYDYDEADIRVLLYNHGVRQKGWND
jgi:hypothetical protein